MKLKASIYLAKSGKISGPFTDDELEKLQATGDLYRYHWIWSHADSSWRPIDAPPTMSPEQWESRAETDLSDYDVIGFSGSTLASGVLKNLDEIGCDFYTPGKETYPKFRSSNVIRVNLLNPKTLQMVNVETQISRVFRTDDGWAYRLKWKGSNGRPAL